MKKLVQRWKGPWRFPAAQVIAMLLLLPVTISLGRIVRRLVPEPDRGWVNGIVAGVVIHVMMLIATALTKGTNNDIGE